MRTPSARGQGAVELALSMLVVVPTFMYVLFLDDLLTAKLDLEEAVVSSPWDYARVNFEEGPAGEKLESVLQQTVCDHSTAYNSYDKGFECGDNHHVPLAAHQCWLTDGSKQVTCTVDKGFGTLFGAVGVPLANNSFTQGGLVRCSARLGVVNYFLPDQLFQQFTTVKMTRTEKMSGGGHDGLAQGAHYLLEEQQAGLLVDSWALGKMERISPTGSGNLKDRTNTIYLPYSAIAGVMGVQFYARILATDVVNPLLLLDGMGDNPVDANVGFHEDYNGTFNGNFHGSPTTPVRGSKYLGSNNAP